MEHVDSFTGIRFARTFFSNNLQPRFMCPDTFEWKESRLFQDCWFGFMLYKETYSLLRSRAEAVFKEGTDNLKEELVNSLNKLIEDCWPEEAKQYNYFFTEERIKVECEQYSLTAKNKGEDNFLAVLRVELVEVIGITQNKNMGNIVFSDTFLNFQGSSRNLTQNICLLKFFFSTGFHFFDRNNYEIAKRLAQTEKFTFNLTEVKGASFTQEWPGHEFSLFINNKTQQIPHFTQLNGSFYANENKMILKDRSLGHFVFEKSEIKEVLIVDSTNWFGVVIVTETRDKLPLAKLATEDTLLVFKDSHLMSKRREFKNLLREEYKAEIIEDQFYSFIAYILTEFEEDNLNYVVNSFHVSGLYDEFAQTLEEKPAEITENSEKPALILNLGLMNSNAESFSALIEENAKFKTVKQLELTSLTDKLPSEADLTVVTVTFPTNFVDLLKIIDFSSFRLLSTCYSVDLACFTSGKGREEFNSLKNVIDCRLCNFVLVEDSSVHKDTATKKLEVLQQIRGGEVFNKRSFTRNRKQLDALFEPHFDEELACRLIKESSVPTEVGERLCLKQETLWEKELFLKFAKKIGIPLDFKEIKEEKSGNKNHKLYSVLMEEQANFNFLLNEVNKAKLEAKSSLIKGIRGCCKFLENPKENFVFSANYGKSVMKSGEGDNWIEFFGANLDENRLREEIRQLNTKIPQKKALIEDLTEEEKDEMNMGMTYAPLPEGWELDSVVFVTPEGERVVIHPCGLLNRFRARSKKRD